MSDITPEKLEKLAEAMDDTPAFAYKEVERLDEKIDTEVTRLDSDIKNISLTPGPQGETGEKGEKGDKGDKGDHGTNGKDGVDGKDGLNGKDGKDGRDGEDGLDGKDGEKGEQGDKGKIPDHKWEKTVLYFEKPDGEWGKGVDLEGPEGQKTIQRITSGGGSSGGAALSGGTADRVAIWNSATTITADNNIKFIQSTGFLGLGLAGNPAARLSLNGNIRFNSTTSSAGVIFSGSNQYISAPGSQNFFAGVSSGNLAVSGNNNTAIGFGALDSITSGSNNFALGTQAFGSITTGSNNVAVSPLAYFTSVSGDLFNNSFLGSNAGVFGDGNENCYFGTLVAANIFGSQNTVIGTEALSQGFIVDGVTGLGYQVFYGSDNFSNSTAIGYQSGYNCFLTGVTLLGYKAGYNGIGANAVAVGHEAGSTASGADNTYIGYSVASTLSGDSNTLVGTNVASTNTSGDGVTILGSNSTVADGSNDTIIIGHDTGLGAGNNCILIANDYDGSGHDNELIIGSDASGNAIISGDMSSRRVGMGAVSSVGLMANLHVGAISNGDTIFRLESTASSGGNPTQNQNMWKVTTTNATPTVLATISVSNQYVFQVTAEIVARRTGGSAGATDDGAAYTLYGVWKYSGGVVQIGTTDKTAKEDQAGWDVNFVVVGTDLTIQVTGATNNNIAWSAFTRINIIHD